jgi:hypothetical protein
MPTHQSEHSQELSGEEIRQLVESLNSTQDDDRTATMLVACGDRAIPPLREFLLHGRLMSASRPRQHAVRALSELGAKDALL